jgi:hypothetical protein
LYWLTGSEVLAPSYRTALRLTGSSGQEIWSYAAVQPDPWRALANEIVRVSYPAVWEPREGTQSLTVISYPAEGTQPLAQVEIALEER